MNKKIIKSFLFIVLLFGYFFSAITPVFAGNLSCEWGPLDNPSSSYHGRLSYCVSGFESVDEFHASTVTLPCISNGLFSNNCGGLGERFFNWATWWTTNGQVVPLSSMTPVLDSDGTYKQCITGPIDSGIKDVIEDCLRAELGKDVLSGVTAGAAVVILAPGPGWVMAAVSVSSALAAGGLNAVMVNDCTPVIRGITTTPNGTCEADLEIRTDFTTQEAGDLYEPVSSLYDICESNLAQNSTALESCKSCASSDGIWTAVGCVEKDPKSMVAKIINIGIGILGGIFLLRVLAAAFMLTTSQGDVKKTSEAKQMITEAVIGVLFILFSVTILEFIGADVLQIPGFGG